jgi:hypothetical protein
MVWDGTPAIFTLKPGPGAAHADTHSCVGWRAVGTAVVRALTARSW